MRDIRLLWLLLHVVVKCSIKCCIRISTVFNSEIKNEYEDFLLAISGFKPVI